MDGKTAREFTEHLVRSGSRPDIITKKRTYEFMDAGAQEFVSQTWCIRDSQEITTVADQAAYDLEPNFLGLYLKDEDPRGGEYFIQLNDGSNTHTITFKSYQKVIYDNQTTSVAIPDNFTLLPKTSLPTKLTGTTTAAGSESGGEATLTDSGESFTSTVDVRDNVHDTANGYDGIVLAITSDSALVSALFDSNGEPQAWGNSTAWAIQPTPKMQLKLDPPPSTAGYTVTVYYLAKPEPVFADYRTWNFNDTWHRAVCFYAAHLYLTEYVVQEEQSTQDAILSQKYLMEFNKIVLRANREFDKSLGKSGYSMRMKV